MFFCTFSFFSDMPFDFVFRKAIFAHYWKFFFFFFLGAQGWATAGFNLNSLFFGGGKYCTFFINSRLISSLFCCCGHKEGNLLRSAATQGEVIVIFLWDFRELTL